MKEYAVIRSNQVTLARDENFVNGDLAVGYLS